MILGLLACFCLMLSASADTLQQIKSRGILLWGGDAEGGAPYSYPDPNKPEQIIGFEAELADALAAKLGVRAKMVQNQWDQLIPALQRGNFDIILNGLELTQENQQRILMSKPYYIYSQQIVTRRETTNITALSGMKGKKVGALSASVAERLLERTPGIDTKVYPGNVEVLRDLKARRINAALMDLPIAQYYAKPDMELAFSGESFAPGYYATGVRKADPKLVEALNVGIEELARDGTLERIYKKYNVWDSRQGAIASFQPERVNVIKAVSTLREWRKYLPLLLRGAVMTVEISVLAMAVAVVAGHMARKSVCGNHSWHASADSIVSDLLRLAADRNSAERLPRGDSWPRPELCRQRIRKLPSWNPGNSTWSNGSGSGAGDDTIANVAAHYSSSSISSRHPSCDERFHSDVQGFLHCVGDHHGRTDQSLRNACDVHVRLHRPRTHDCRHIFRVELSGINLRWMAGKEDDV
jgi:ABC-type amino acid transport substrate-binding protein